MLTLRNFAIRSRKKYPPKFHYLEVVCLCNVFAFLRCSPQFLNNFLSIPKTGSLMSFIFMLIPQTKL